MTLITLLTCSAAIITEARHERQTPNWKEQGLNAMPIVGLYRRQSIRLDSGWYSGRVLLADKLDRRILTFGDLYPGSNVIGTATTVIAGRDTLRETPQS